jgi:serum/glucocorticoid-regulated kinase 2
VVTNKAVYNFAPKGFIYLFKSRLRRRITYDSITGLTVSRYGSEFVIHIKKEHDYRLSSKQYKLNFVKEICQGYCKAHSSEMPCFYKDDLALIEFTTTVFDRKEGISRMPKEKPVMLNPENVLSIQESKASSTLVFSKKGLKETHLESFRLIKTLGRGAFGKVMLC